MKLKPSAKPGRLVVEVDAKDQQLLVESLAAPPFRLRKILVPVDFSECSKKALQYAVAFARQFRAHLTLLNVVQISYPTGELGPLAPPMADAEVEEANRNALADLAKTEIGADVPTIIQIRVGRPAEEIVLAARELEIDLIIISTHGRTGLKHVLLGSTTEHVVRRGPCPVLTVREQEHDFVPPPRLGASR
jgi:universal stress protein A